MTTSVTRYEVVIGIEVHAQLLTKSKMFCSCSKDYFGSPMNSHVCPTCLAMPGVMPVINRQAVEFTIMTGLALNCTIPQQAKFDRKNYHYPDLMKGYQISQYDLPLCQNGWLEVDLDGETKRIGVTRVHLEEDTARSMHRTNAAGENYSLIDVNRSGVPLMEIVSEPDVRSAKEARLYVMKLQQIMRYLGVSQANLEEGNMRCEPNISLRPVGQKEFGQKVELKNLGSFRSVERGVNFEIERQTALLESGEPVAHETRGWRDDRGETVSQRSKEMAQDYRYFPEPDLPLLAISTEYVDQLRAELPELPDPKRERFVQEYGLSIYDANLLTADSDWAAYYEAAIAADPGEGTRTAARAKTIANWMLQDYAQVVNAQEADFTGSDGSISSRVPPPHLNQLVQLVEADTVSKTGAKSVFVEMMSSGKPPQQVVEEQGLTQISGADEIGAVVDEVIAANPDPVADYRGGKATALQFLVGQVMRQTRGRAKPDVVSKLLTERLNG